MFGTSEEVFGVHLSVRKNTSMNIIPWCYSELTFECHLEVISPLSMLALGWLEYKYYIPLRVG